MSNPVCISPLKFYDSLAKQSHRKSYAYGHISPLITKTRWVPAFQFIIPTQLYEDSTGIFSVHICDAKTNESIYAGVSNATGSYINLNYGVRTVDGYKVFMHTGKQPIPVTIPEGLYYIKIISDNSGIWTYYSEVFCFDNVTKDCLELEYWNETGNFAVKNGVIAFPADFHFKLLLKGEIGKPEYNFEEESTKRLGYIYVESQVSKKTYKFNTIVPEYICDALRLVRLCDNKIIRCKDDEYEAITFEMEAEWQTQGDLASVTCEFETDNVVANIGGFVPDKLGGDYNNDYNEDFDKE